MDTNDCSSAAALCRVCELLASGNNFGVPTCESCKTFFRRNAKRDPRQLKCLHQNTCNVLREYRRSCAACRLQKCFEAGMKKELILSDEKLKSRAKPTFKKPRYRWCRLPAGVDAEQLMSALVGGCVQVKQEPTRGSDSPDFQQQQQQEQQAQQHQQQQQGGHQLSPSMDAAPLSVSASMSPASDAGASVGGGGSFFRSSTYSRLCDIVANYQQPYEQKCGPTLSSKLGNIEEGFCTLENSVRKMIRLIPDLPGFEGIDKQLLSRIVKWKVFGGIQIISLLTYDYDREAWVVLLEDGGGLQEAVLNTREAIVGTFMSLTRQCCPSGRPMFTRSDVDRIPDTLQQYYAEMLCLFGDKRKAGALILLGVYLLEDDAGLELRPEEKAMVRALQWRYLQHLDGLIGSCEHSAEAAGYKSKRALLLLLPIRWLDVRYSDSSRVIQISHVTPLMQELAAG